MIKARTFLFTSLSILFFTFAETMSGAPSEAESDLIAYVVNSWGELH